MTTPYNGGLASEATMRDFFAAEALNGMVSGSQGLVITVKEFAAQSYKLADAMLAQRDSPRQSDEPTLDNYGG